MTRDKIRDIYVVVYFLSMIVLRRLPLLVRSTGVDVLRLPFLALSRPSPSLSGPPVTRGSSPESP